MRADADLTPEFVGSIKQHGVLQAVRARRAEDGTLVVLEGQRRTLGAVEAARETIPVQIIDGTEDEARRIVEQLTENDHRKGMRDAHRTAAYRQLSLEIEPGDDILAAAWYATHGDRLLTELTANGTPTSGGPRPRRGTPTCAAAHRRPRPLPRPAAHEDRPRRQHGHHPPHPRRLDRLSRAGRGHDAYAGSMAGGWPESERGLGWLCAGSLVVAAVGWTLIALSTEGWVVPAIAGASSGTAFGSGWRLVLLRRKRRRDEWPPKTSTP
ncbi:ParB N-terminal domain-containing protein [Cellulosimicrobium terreum]|nr:ParB N-terminal domain-containing protein [Cellulosimicrobium terreum]